MSPSPDFWRGKRVFLTGNTGFKGTWLWLWLLRLGAVPTGFALAPETDPSLWDAIGPIDAKAVTGDIRDAARLALAMKEAAPDIVLHLAAQALVRRSYAEPVETMTSNVLGTVNVLEAVRACPSVKAVVSVTTDKVYLNREWLWPYREDEALGGRDPYSASKACAEIVTTAWARSFLDEQGVRVATARAGNVIGGGDWSRDRLLPDCIAALAKGETISIRNPAAVRPWQHVLEPLSGYLALAERLCAPDGSAATGGWNFGPHSGDVQPVSWVADRMVESWGGGASWRHDGDAGPHEAGLLALDSSKARASLGWEPRLSLSEGIGWTVGWARRHLAGEPARDLIVEQIEAYERRGAKSA